MLKRLALGISAVVLSVSTSASEIESYIVNGTVTSTSAYPSYARLYYNEYGNYGYCGGTFIDATHVLTAAHCVALDDTEATEVRLLFTVAVPNLDDEDDISNASKYYISKFYVHEDYDSSQFTNDIAILVLEEAVNLSSYAEFVGSENEYRIDGGGGASQTFIAVGHGDTSSGVDSTTKLLETEVDYMENSACIEYYSSGAPDSQLCMSGEKDTSGSGLRNATCNGDSGGPLYWTEGSGKQVGITSYGPGTDTGCGDPEVQATSVFTEVIDYAGWISNVQNGLVSATYTTSESDREYYRQNGYLPDVVSDVLGSGDGGGSVPIWSIFALLGMAIFRKK